MKATLRNTLYTAIAIGLGGTANVQALDQPDWSYCDTGPGIFAEWQDVSFGNTKYGGEVEAQLGYLGQCYVDGAEYYSELEIEVELSRDEEDLFAYSCDGAECEAEMSGEEFSHVIYEALYADIEQHCGVDGGESIEGDISSLTFSVKHMNPGKGKGPQNYTKLSTECVDL